VNATAQPAQSLQREWWLRTLAVLQSPRAVFGALRDDSTDAAEARQEPILALIILAGVAGILSTPLAGRMLDDSAYGSSTFVVLALAFIGGFVYATIVYWLGGLIVYALATGIAARASYRQARHVVGFAAAPIALTLVLVWPLRIAIYGNDLFRSGGSDTGLGDRIFDALMIASYVWTLGLAALGLLELKRSSSSSGIS